MKLKQKNIFWKLTFPFAHSNYTTIGETIYYPKGRYPSLYVIDHEKVHMEQQKQVGVLKFMFLYLFCFPLFRNKYRYKWEYEAFTKGSKLSHEETVKILSSYQYGWLCKK